MSDEPQKRCPDCGKTFPATTDFFYVDHHRESTLHLRSKCKTCYNKANHQKYKKPGRKEELRCKTCGNTYPATIEFFRSVCYKGETFVRSPCKSCLEKKQGSTEPGVRNLTRAPSDRCGACGATSGNILGDVNTTTMQRYGYLCTKCYRIVHEFGREPNRLHSVLAYMKRTRKWTRAKK